jgi:Tfp pilus assembly protein PilO
MKLPRNYFENLSAGKYREYLKILPNIKKENTKATLMLIFTFLGLSLLGIFAISPTLSTIIELRKQLEDSNFVYEKLTTKMENLSNLQQQYEVIKVDLPFVFDAIPKTAAASPLIGQVEAISQKTNVRINSLRVGETELTNNKQNQITTASFNFSLEAEGSYEDLINFTSSLSFFNRIITIESISLNKDPRREVLVLSIKGKGYFKK